MKRLSGITLDEILAARETEAGADHGAHGAVLPRFTEQQLLRAFVEICLAIEFAHTRGVLHRDLKPANMLLGEFGEVYVFDWGVARVLDEIAPATDTTRPTLEQFANTAGVLGTPGYMSPEQVCGDELDGRADVYALGCVRYAVLLVAVAAEFAYSGARRGRDARRELHIQAWHLRQLMSLDDPPRRDIS